ncbi:MAG: hypothetical protein Q8K26_00825, partial [Candidatus Gracilibacteria bacterium]|nr:hypothetical protein [Candidatus Gracilibacteria bacterium]
MRKLSTLQIILIVLFVGIIIFGFFISRKKSNIDTNKTQTGATMLGTTSLQEAEQKQLQEKTDMYIIYNNAVDTLDVAACEKIAGDDKLKTECTDNVYSALASREKNITFCEKIQDTTIKAHCMNSFIYDTAIASGKQSDCGKITGDSDLKKACEKNIVFAQIEDQSFSGTISTCESLTGVDKDYCVNRIKKDTDIDLLQKGTNTQDLSICGQIRDITMKNTCTDTVYMALAMKKQDGLLCAKIVDAGRRANCNTQFARVNDANILQKAITGNNLPMCKTII